MKSFKQLLESLPSKTVVFAFGRFNPPTIGHQLLVQFTKKLAQKYSADYLIYASRTQDKKKNPLNVQQKLHELNLMFPNTQFVGASDTQRTVIEVAKHLNSKYSSLVLVAGSDRVPEFKKLLDKYNGKEYNYQSIQVISAGERDPDSDDVSGMSASKMRAAASKGNFNQFKKGLPASMRDIDAKRLMNDVRVGLGLQVIKENVSISVSQLRDKYFNKQIYNVGDIVETVNGQQLTIIKRSTNHVICEDVDGITYNKWISEIFPKES